MKKVVSIISLAILFANGVRSQPVQPNITNISLVNRACPDFIFDTLINYKKERLAIAELKGKFVIIDFWGTFCLPCIADFPKLEKLQEKYKDSLHILLVATDGYQRAKGFYETREKSHRPMILPCAVNRNVVKYFQVKTVSTYVWIDDQGYIKAITDDTQITAQNVADFIHGKDMRLREMEKKVVIDRKKHLVTVAHEMDSSSVIYSSSLTKHLKGVRPTYSYAKKGIKKIHVQNMPIRNLYQIAFGDTGRSVTFNRTVIECTHPEKIACPKDDDFETWKIDNTYCYELIVPEEKQDDMLKIMREDLNRLFGLKVSMETREKKCLVLSAEKNPRFLADKDLTPKLSMNAGGITVKNHPFAMLTEMIQHYNQDKILLDETGIADKIDIAIQAEMNNPDAVQEALKKYGLTLRYENRQVQMLVIRDAVKQ